MVGNAIPTSIGDTLTAPADAPLTRSVRGVPFASHWRFGIVD
jgi:hypothetical protein